MSRALQGKHIVNTRAVHQAAAFDGLLRAKGAVPLAYPCIAIVPPEDGTELDAGLRDLSAGYFDWLVLTSTNTVLAIAQRLKALGLSLAGTPFRTAAIGTATAEAAHEQLGLERIDVPSEYIAESLAAYLPVEKGTQVLLPESVIAWTTLADMLSARGAVVRVVDAYQTVCGSGGVDVPQRLAQRQIDAITFTSSSTVTGFLERLDKEGGHREDALKLCAACIGPKTAATARDCGFSAITMPADYTLEGLLVALENYFAQRMATGEKL